jgi:hypothetical protein
MLSDTFLVVALVLCNLYLLLKSQRAEARAAALEERVGVLELERSWREAP